MQIYLILASVLVAGLAPSCRASCSDDFLRRGQRNPFEGKTITVVTVNDSVSFVERQGQGVPYGFNIDLLNLIGYIYRTNFNYVFKTFSELIAAVQGDEDTISFATQTVTTARIQLIDFAQFFKSGNAFLVRTSFSGSITGLSSLCGRRVAALSGSIQQAALEEQNTRCGSNQIQIVIGSSLTEDVQLVLNGSVQIALGDEAGYIPVVRESNNRLKLTGTPYDVQPYGIGCNKNNRQLCCGLVNAINHLIEEGVYGELLTRYGFTYRNNGICPSRINLQGETCASKCRPGAGQCRENLS